MAEQPKDLYTSVELLKRDVGMINKLVDKFDVTIDKLQEVANDISRVVSIQELKMNAQDKINSEVGKMLDRQNKEYTDGIKEVQKKIDGLHSSLSREIQTVKEDLDNKIKSLEAWRYAIMTVISIVVFLVSTLSSTIIKSIWG